MFTYQENTSADHEMNVLAIEANVFSNLADSIRKLFPSIIDKFRSSFAKTTEMPDIPVDITTAEKKCIKKLDTIKYVNISDIVVMKPEGLKSDFLSYSIDLHKVLESYSDISTRLLDPFYAEIVLFLSNKESRKTTRDKSKEISAIKKQRDHCADLLGQHFIDSSHISKAKYETVARRNTDVVTLIGQMHRTRNVIESISITELNKTCKKCLDVIEAIVEEVENKAVDSISPEAARNLAQFTIEAARELEFLAAVYFMYVTMQTCSDALVEQLNAI